jgi:hypothetical protein
VKKILLCFLLLNLSFSAYSVSITREIDRDTIGNKQSAVVTVHIVKTGVDGIAKLIEKIPDGFRAFVSNTGGGKVLVGEEGELKIVWLTLPVTDKLKIQYKLIHMGSSFGASKIRGSFTYIQNDVIQEQSIAPLQIIVEAGVVESETVVIPSMVKKAVYKVQLGVFSSEKSINVFKGLPEIHFKKVNGFYKYFSGKFDTEAEAKKVIPQAKSKGFPGAFLVRVK